CILAGLLANRLRGILRTPALISKNLEMRGVPMIGGRSSVVLREISLQDCMVSDFEVISEREPLVDLYGRIQKARYPFLPVVDSKGAYLGLLTIDMIQEGWQAREVIATGPLSKLVEAKDLLYSTGFKAPTVQIDEKISNIPNLFEDIPCVPVLGKDRKILGLLFVHNLRLAYDREIARQSLPFRTPARKD
ncbi:MAG: CBS domain-containing protein, partial [Bdellovibrio sp.]|nr:CBS domain-containing protein [Bdellovibrio sp.]